MVQHYTDWERRKSKVRKEFPWLSRNWGWVSNAALAIAFVWCFGAIYKLQWFPPPEIVSRSVDPRFGDDKALIVKRFAEREKAMIKKMKAEKSSLTNEK